MTLVVQHRILHRDVSVNNTMIYVCDTAESEAKNYGPSRDGESGDDDEAPGGEPPCPQDSSKNSQVPGDDTSDSEEGEILEQNLAQWERQRCEQIKAGKLRSGLLVDFDYATDIGQALPVVPGDRTVGIPPPSTLPFYSSILIRGPYRSCQPISLSTTRKR